MANVIEQPKIEAKPASPYRHGEYFGALDGFRGLLALLVAVYHTPWESWFNNTAFMDNGTVLIDLFFVFSGFLMFTLYGTKINSVKDGRAFIWRRIARLYPIHFFMTMVFLAFALVRILAHKVGLSVHEPGEILPFMAGAQENWSTLVSNLTLTHAMGLHESLSFNPPSWTISVEFFAYFVFCAVLLWARPHKAIHFFLITGLVAFGYAFLASQKPNMDITYDLAFIRCLCGFFTGVIAAEFYKKTKERTHKKNLKLNTKSHFLEVLILVMYIVFTMLFGGKLQFFVGIVVFGFVLIFAHDRGFISRFMMQPVFQYLAKISYSVYMIHVIIAIFFDVLAERFLAGFFGQNWHDTAIWGDLYIFPYLIAVIAASHICVKYIEQPGGRLIRNFSKRI